MKTFINQFAVFLLLGCLSFLVCSCSDDDNVSANYSTGTVTGIITDDYNTPLEGVAVKVEGTELTTVTNAEGEYTLNGVSVQKNVITFSKADYQTFSVTVTPTSYNKGVALVNAAMEYAAAKITGVVLDAKNGNAPKAGVKVSISETQSVTTGADGRFVIDNLPLDAYTVTFIYEGYETITRTVGIDGFVDGTAIIDVTLGGRQILPHKTLDDLLNCDYWYFNEYTGGRNATAYPHWDWSTDFMATMDFYGNWEEQNEGTTLRIRNDEADRSNPANLQEFDSYVYGMKHIT
ncbi:MAG: carboxypeptidase regulatory-like domain-containing protein, partial [Prevotella sp.]|nr:carboxypeptidase regulatory-like domain-containing protein [Prevotella sp.]